MSVPVPVTEPSPPPASHAIPSNAITATGCHKDKECDVLHFLHDCVGSDENCDCGSLCDILHSSTYLIFVNSINSSASVKKID